MTKSIEGVKKERSSSWPKLAIASLSVLQVRLERTFSLTELRVCSCSKSECHRKKEPALPRDLPRRPLQPPLLDCPAQSDPWRQRSFRIRGPDHRIGYGTYDPSEQRGRHGDEVLELEGVGQSSCSFLTWSVPNRLDRSTPPSIGFRSGPGTDLLSWGPLLNSVGQRGSR